MPDALFAQCVRGPLPVGRSTGFGLRGLVHLPRLGAQAPATRGSEENGRRDGESCNRKEKRSEAKATCRSVGALCPQRCHKVVRAARALGEDQAGEHN